MGGGQWTVGGSAALIAALLLADPDRARSGGPAERLLLVEGASPAASLTAIDYDAAQPGGAAFRFAVDGDEFTVTDGLVRWGAPAPSRGGATLYTTDGSKLVTDRPWSASGYLRADDDSVSLHRKGGWIAVERSRAARATLNGAEGETRSDEASDAVQTIDGDRLLGSVREVSRDKLTLVLDGAREALDVPVSRVAGIEFGGARVQPPRRCCLVGLADSSLLYATAIRPVDGAAELATPAGLRVGVATDSIVFLQPMGAPIEYLSDREADDFQHTPYFEIVWPYARDGALRGGPLVAAGRRHAKGLAVRSASRLVYRLDGRHGRFQAEGVLADQSDPDVGSVVFRVYLVRGGEIESAYESPIVRGGDAPAPIDVDVTDAAALVLVVDYADGGDAGDDAVWLDARLVAAGS